MVDKPGAPGRRSFLPFRQPSMPTPMESSRDPLYRAVVAAVEARGVPRVALAVDVRYASICADRQYVRDVRGKLEVWATPPVMEREPDGYYGSGT